jgi:hypothetical protein
VPESGWAGYSIIITGRWREMDDLDPILGHYEQAPTSSCLGSRHFHKQMFFRRHPSATI